MIVLEHDAKELLAVQGFPVPGGIQLTQVPKYDNAEAEESSGPWLVKPQIASVDGIPPDRIILATTRREVADATAQLLGKRIANQTVHAVRVERRFESASAAYLGFICDPVASGVRVALESFDAAASGSNGTPHRQSETVAPDPNAVIACVNRLASGLPTGLRAPVIAAATQLAPLYFGYEALQLEIDPLRILSDGGWIAGDVRMIIDENALFRHPEIISMIERRDFAYHEVRRKRAHGIDHLVLNPGGTVGTIATGGGLASNVIDEIVRRGLLPYNYMEANPEVIAESTEALATSLGWLAEAKKLRVVLVTALDGVVDVTEFARRFSEAIALTPALTAPIVARFVGENAGEAEDILRSMPDRISFQRDYNGAFDSLPGYLAGDAPA